MPHKNLFYDRLEKESEPNILPEYDVDVAHLSTNDVNNINYKVCCPMCDNEKCVKGTDECELERWKAKRLRGG